MAKSNQDRRPISGKRTNDERRNGKAWKGQAKRDRHQKQLERERANDSKRSTFPEEGKPDGKKV